jgi:exosome complex exonuclease DIS3/RRP44
MLGKKIKDGRIRNGALSLASSEVKITFDAETHDPTDVCLYKTFDTNSTVEEFMLLANVAVAEKIVQHYPSNSILRRHPAPKFNQVLSPPFQS